MLLKENVLLLDSSQWKVPVAVCTSASPQEPVAESLLEKDSCTVLVPGVGKDQWIKVNGVSFRSINGYRQATKVMGNS